MNPAVLCTLDSNGAAQRVVATLRHVGFSSDRISVLFARAKDDSETGVTDADPDLDWLVGVGSVDSADLGAFYAAGPVLASLSAAQEDAAVGGTVGVLRALGLSAEEAEEQLAEIVAGRILVAVHAEDPRGRELARQTCVSGGVLDIRLTAED